MRKTFFLSVIAALLAVGLFSCKDDKNKNDNTNNSSSTPKGVTLDFTAYFGSQKISFGDMAYARSNGESITLLNWGILMSKLSLIKSDNTELMLGDGYQFVSFENNRVSFNYPTIPAGSYKGVKFMIGVDSLINHADPGQWAAKHPMNPNVNFQHWGWAGGYIFNQLDGRYTTSGSTTAKGMSYHQATDQMTNTITLLKDFEITDANALKTLSVGADIKYYFDGPPNTITIDNEPASHSQGTAEVATMKKLIANQSGMFTLSIK